MLAGFLLTASVLTQFVTAFLAIKLIGVTGTRISWGLIALAISFMAVRRSVSLYHFVSDSRAQLDMSFEVIGLITSVLMLAGVVLISPLFRSMASEIAQRKKAEEALSQSEKELSSITSSLAEGIYVLDQDGRITFMNPEAERLLGWTMDEMNAKGGHDLVHFLKADGTPLPFEECKMHNVIRTRTLYSSTDEVFVRRDGTVFPISVISSPIIEDGRVVASVTAFQDITGPKELEKELREMSLTDELTGLYNRRGFLTLVEQHGRIAKRQKSKVFLLYVDVDNLKTINDTFGHHEGDVALKETAIILKETFRESDITARLGGDEFVVVSLENSQGYEERVIARLQENLDRFNAKRGGAYDLSVSYGVSYYDPESALSIHDVLFQADRSMYEQKKRKKS